VDPAAQIEDRLQQGPPGWERDRGVLGQDRVALDVLRVEDVLAGIKRFPVTAVVDCLDSLLPVEGRRGQGDRPAADLDLVPRRDFQVPVRFLDREKGRQIAEVIGPDVGHRRG
jgi:hypothetical protein